MKSVYHVFGGCGERAGSGGRGAEHHRKGRVTLQHSTEREEINSDKLQIYTNYYRRKRRVVVVGGTHRGQPTDT